MSRRLTSSAMRYLDIWHGTVRSFDSVEPGSPEERALYAAVNIALPAPLRWKWQVLADELGCNVRTLRRDARRPEVRALAEAGRLKAQGVCAMLALRIGIVKVAAAAARGEPEAVVALAQTAVALGLGARTLEPLHVSGEGRASLETPEAAEALAAVLAELEAERQRVELDEDAGVPPQTPGGLGALHNGLPVCACRMICGLESTHRPRPLHAGYPSRVRPGGNRNGGRTAAYRTPGSEGARRVSAMPEQAVSAPRRTIQGGVSWSAMGVPMVATCKACGGELPAGFPYFVPPRLSAARAALRVSPRA